MIFQQAHNKPNLISSFNKYKKDLSKDFFLKKISNKNDKPA